MTKHQGATDDAHERPSRLAKSQALESAVWRGAARVGRKKLGSNSPPRVPQTAKKARSKLAHSGKHHGADTKVNDSSVVGQRNKVTRKRPVAISSGEDEDSQKVRKHPRKNTRQHSGGIAGRKRRDQDTDDDSASDTSSVDTSSDASTDEEDVGDGADDLRELDAEGLASALAFERPRWGSALHNVRDDVAGNVELTTASEPDVRPFEDGEQDEDINSQADNEDEVLQGPGVPPRTGPRHKASKRELARRAEVPRFSQDISATSRRPRKNIKRHDLDSEGSSNDDMANFSNDDIMANPSRVNNGWHVDSHYVSPQAGARIISIKVQPSPLQSVIKAAIREVTGDALFVMAYPSAVTISGYYIDILKRSAGNLNLGALQERFEKDQKFGDVISRVLAMRLSTLRGSVKKIAASEVKGFYHLIPGDACKNRVKDLITKTEYIYSHCTSTGLLLRTKPFHHACVISTLKEWIFTSVRGASLADKHARRFKSSILEGPQAAELELPIAMVCAAAAAIHASLDDWADGHYRKTDFNADLYEDVYEGHVGILVGIRDKKPAAYHRLMADLYNAVSSRRTQQAAAVTNSGMALLDIDGMDV